MLRKSPCECASAEVETDAGDKNDDEVETEVFVGADLLVDKVWPCDSNKAKMLLSVWHVMFKQKNLKEKPPRNETKTVSNDGDQWGRKTKENGWKNLVGWTT